jgi:hypothetical protein
MSTLSLRGLWTRCPSTPTTPHGADERCSTGAARALQRLEWRSIAPATDDFVVFAVDLALSDLQGSATAFSYSLARDCQAAHSRDAKRRGLGEFLTLHVGRRL